MKMIKYILTTLSLLLAFGACSEDDKLTYNPNNAAPGELANIAASYVLKADKAGEKVETFNWGVFDMGYDASVTYTLEVDLGGKSFANAQELASGNIRTADITVGKLNAAMINLQQVYGFEDETEQTVEFRVKGILHSYNGGPNPSFPDPVYTNVITTKVTPYPADVDYPAIHVMGDYSGWSWDKAQKIFSFNMNNMYEGWIFFDGKAANGMKLAIPKLNDKGELEWDNNANWGLQEGQTPSAEDASMILWSDGGSGNIKCYSKKFYRFSFNKSTLELKMLNSMNTLGIIGDGANGWGDNDDIPFDFDTEKQVFVATATLKNGGIKFRADKTWGAINLGLATKTTEYAPKGTLVNTGSENIPVVAGTYKITVNLNNPAEMTYKIEAGTAIDPSKIVAQKLNTHADLAMNQNKSDELSWVALDFGGQNPSTVNYTVEMALKGTNFANAQVLETTKETTLSISGDKYLEALKALGKDIDQAVDVDVRVTATVSGITNTYTSNVVSYKLTVKTPPTYTETLYMIGSEFGNWDWTSANVVDMIPVNGVAGSFWTIKYFTAGQGFKWFPAKNWDNGFAQLGSHAGYDFDKDSNAIVPSNGLYIVYVDMAADKIVIEPAKIFGMGNAFGGWTMGDYPFTITGDKASITITNNTADKDGGLRMYASSSLAPANDWWKMEFTIAEGKIVYRGNGGDPARLDVTVGQVVTLDFNAGTGTIK